MRHFYDPTRHAAPIRQAHPMDQRPLAPAPPPHCPDCGHGWHLHRPTHDDPVGCTWSRTWWTVCGCPAVSTGGPDALAIIEAAPTPDPGHRPGHVTLMRKPLLATPKEPSDD